MSSSAALPFADLAPTGRARCMQCGAAIEKGSVRVGAARDPEDVQGYSGPVTGYLHPGCALAWIAPRWPAGAEDFVEKVRANSALPELPEPFGAASAAGRQQAAAERAAKVPGFGALKSAKVVSLAKKITETPDHYKVNRLIEKAGLGYGEMDAFRWHLARHGLVSPMHEGMLRGLAESAARTDTDAIFEVLPRMGPGRGNPVLPAWPRDADLIAAQAHRRDPERFAALAALPQLRLAVGFVRGRFGLPVPEADRAEILDGLAAIEAEEYGLPRIHGAEGSRIYLEMPGGDRSLESALQLAAMFGDPEAWAEALARHARRARFLRPENVELGLARLPADAMVEALRRARLNSGQELEASLARVVAARPAEDLVAAVRALPKEGYCPAREPLYLAVMAGVERVPEGMEAEISWKDFTYSVAPWRNRPELREIGARAALALGRERALRLIDLLLEREWDRACVLGLLGVVWDEARFTRAVALSNGGLSPDAMAAVGAPALPALVAFQATAPEERLRTIAALWIRGIIAAEGVGGRGFDPALDRFVSVDPEQDYWSGDAQTLLAGALRGMDPARREAVVRRLLEEGRRPERALFAATQVGNPALVQAAAQRLVRGFAGVSDTSLLRRVLVAAGPEAFSSGLAGCDPQLFEHLAEAFGRDKAEAMRAEAGVIRETKLQRLSRLAQEAAGPKTRIYLLERPGWEEGLPPRPASSRAASRGEGPVTVEDFEHVLTLDLDEIPELKARFPGAGLLSLYARDVESGEDWEGAKLRALAGGAPRGGNPILVLPVEVPVAIFDSEAAAADPALDALRGLVFNRPGWVLGGPMYIQEDEGEAGFLMQLAESIGDLNLGDCGSLYVFEGACFMQCH